MFYLSCFCFMSCHLKEIEIRPTVYSVVWLDLLVFDCRDKVISYLCIQKIFCRLVISPGKNKFLPGKIKVFSSKSPGNSWNLVLKTCWPPWRGPLWGDFQPGLKFRVEILSRLNSKLLFKMTLRLHVKISTRFRGRLYGDFNPGLKFQLVKPSWNFISVK